MFDLKLNPPLENGYGDRVSLGDDGLLSISGFDGHTILTPDDARKLAAALVRFADAAATRS